MLSVSFTKLDELSSLLLDEEKLARNTLELLRQARVQNQELALYDPMFLEEQIKFWQRELHNIQQRIALLATMSETLARVKQQVSRDVASAEDALRNLI